MVRWIVGGALLVCLAAVAVWQLREDDPEPPVVERDTTPDAEPEPGLADGPVTVPLARTEIEDDPTKDGWDTEAKSAKAQKALKKLAYWVAHPEERGELPEAACGPLRPAGLARAFEDRAITVQRGECGGERTSLAAALAAFARPYDGARDVGYQIKVVRVTLDGTALTTKALASFWARTPAGMLEEHTTWTAVWDKELRLQRLDAGAFEQVTTRHAGGPLFADCTRAVFAGSESFDAQLAISYAYWFSCIPEKRYFQILGTPGLAVGDVDGDGLDDLYVCQEQGLPNLLYLRNPDGTVRDAAASAGVDWLEDSRSALLVDLDNDGDQDLAVGVLGGVVLASNDGSGSFTIRGVLPTAEDLMSICAADYDADGDLDLYACGYMSDQTLRRPDADVMAATAAEFVLHDANNGAPNSLWRNDGAWSFTDSTRDVGLGANNSRFSFVATWEDYDNDGDLDLYVANDYGRDNLYRNEGGRFVDISDKAGAESAAGGMSATWADYDRDGHMDLLVSAMFSSAGNRVTFQDRFKPDAPVARRRLQGFARGNSLLRNDGRGGFRQVAAAAGVEMGRWAWGSHFFDLNNDGWEDVLVANGYLTGDVPDDL